MTEYRDSASGRILTIVATCMPVATFLIGAYLAFVEGVRIFGSTTQHGNESGNFVFAVICVVIGLLWVGWSAIVAVAVFSVSRRVPVTHYWFWARLVILSVMSSGLVASTALFVWIPLAYALDTAVDSSLPQTSISLVDLIRMYIFVGFGFVAVSVLMIIGFSIAHQLRARPSDEKPPV